jgi:hypothetical protein
MSEDNGYLSGFINDGQSRKFFLRGSPQRYSDVRGEYRPALPEERSMIVADTQGAKDPAQAERILAKSLATRILSWDLRRRDAEGGLIELKITAQNILGLDPGLMYRLVNIAIYGSDGGDVDPAWKTAEKIEHDETAQDSALSGAGFGDQALENTEKN